MCSDCVLPVKLLSGNIFNVPLKTDDNEMSFQNRVADVLSVTQERITLLNGDRFVEPSDLAAIRYSCDKELLVLTAIIAGMPARWLDEYLSEEGPWSKVKKHSTCDTLSALAIGLKNKLPSSDRVLKLAGRWRYGPRTDDSRLYEILMETDGSCKIAEALEGRDLEDDSLGHVATCEWTGIWTSDTGGTTVHIEAFPVAELLDGAAESSTVPDVVCTSQGSLIVDQNMTELRFVRPYALERLVTVPRSRGLRRVRQ